LRVNAGDTVSLPDIGVDLAIDILKLVDLDDWCAAVASHRDLAGLFERLRVDKMDGRGAVAHNELLAIGGQPPAFAGIAKLLELGERMLIIHEADMGLPGELVHFITQQSNPLA